MLRELLRAGEVVQVAGFYDADEARMLADSGVQLLGLPLRLAVHAQDITEDQARRVLEETGLGPRTVVITYEPDPAKAVQLARYLGAGGLQMHCPMPPDGVAGLRRLAPDLLLLKSLIVRDGFDPARAVAGYAPHVDGFLTDTFDPATGATGATGKTHDWDASRRLAELSPVPVILAGGLNPGNVAESIRAVRPAGVDAHTGLEGPDGRKEEALVQAFARAALQAFAEPR